MNLYMVVKTAIYDHGCLGIFDTLEQASNVALSASKLEDGHHNFEVRPFVLNKAAYSFDWEEVKNYRKAEAEDPGWHYCDAVMPHEDVWSPKHVAPLAVFCKGERK